MMKSTVFVGRVHELSRLNALVNNKKSSFVLIKGRRRIGKSRLVDQFSKSFDHYYKFEGLAPELGVTAEHQLEEFSRQLSRQFKTAKTRYDDWSDALWSVGERVQRGKILLFFDEISWMSDQSPTFLAKLKSFWDNQLSKNPQLIFVACSSISSWVERNLLSSTAFVGRISLTLTLEELPLPDCNQFWPDNIAPYEKLKVLAVTGGIPRYLEEINPKNSAEENIKQLCFTDGALLVNEFNRIFSDLFLRESRFYEKIVTLLSTGAKSQTLIQKEINKENDAQRYGRLTEYLSELEEANFIRRDYTWDIIKGSDSKLSVYRLRDNYLRFYLKYIKKNMSKIKRGAFHLKSLTALPEWNAIMGLQFENLVLNNRLLLHKVLQIKPDEIVNENPFLQRKTQRVSGCQIDYLIQTKFNSLYVCEIKFSKNVIDVDVINEVKDKINKLKFPKGYSCRPVLIHVNGVSDDVTDSDYFSDIIDMGALLQE
ncbi:MAG TPA: ATP-binding protein [Gammaproteobacteria bacterium]|nr:ATP-binding protein [Gammaproteobacteria bacterium]